MRNQLREQVEGVTPTFLLQRMSPVVGTSRPQVSAAQCPELAEADVGDRSARRIE
jgi:hypothetical protein